MRLTTASRARRMFWNEPRMWMWLRPRHGQSPALVGPRCARACLSARTMRVRVAFSMANLVRPPLPAMRPMARDRCSPFSVFTGHRTTARVSVAGAQGSRALGPRTVLDLKAVDVQVVHPQQRQGVLRRAPPYGAGPQQRTTPMR
jgi:hypothetical protein